MKRLNQRSIAMSDKQTRDEASATKKKKHTSRNSEQNSSSVCPPHVGASETHSNKTKTRYANVSNKNCNGSINWQKYLQENSDGIKRPMVKSTQNFDPKSNNNNSTRNDSSTHLSKVLGMDCEMVGIGEDGRDSILARVSIVNGYGDCVYDKFVKPREAVSDYRTHVSGVREDDLANGEEFDVVQKDVATLIKGKIVVGHALQNDMDVLYLSHPRKFIRDTSKFFRKGGCRTPSLKNLALQYLGVKIQEGEHSSVQDAKAAVMLYNLYHKQWERGGGSRRHNRIDTYHNTSKKIANPIDDT